MAKEPFPSPHESDRIRRPRRSGEALATRMTWNIVDDVGVCSKNVTLAVRRWRETMIDVSKRPPSPSISRSFDGTNDADDEIPGQDISQCFFRVEFTSKRMKDKGGGGRQIVRVVTDRLSALRRTFGQERPSIHPNWRQMGRDVLRAGKDKSRNEPIIATSCSAGEKEKNDECSTNELHRQSPIAAENNRSFSTPEHLFPLT